MITENMTTAEIYSHMHKDMDLCCNKILYEQKQWKKLCKKNPPKADFAKVCTLVSKQTVQTYYLVFVHIGKTQLDPMHIFAKVQTNRGFDYYEFLPSEKEEDIIMYTPHFFDRYKERMNVVGNIKDIIYKFKRNNHVYHRIYSRDKYRVYAIKDGIALAIAEKDRMRFMTFIPYKMLKPSQIAAFDSVRQFFNDEAKVLEILNYSSGSHAHNIQMFQHANHISIDNAEYLYSLFYQEKIPTDLTNDVDLSENRIVYINPKFKKELDKYKI